MLSTTAAFASKAAVFFSRVFSVCDGVTKRTEAKYRTGPKLKFLNAFNGLASEVQRLNEVRPIPPVRRIRICGDQDCRTGRSLPGTMKEWPGCQHPCGTGWVYGSVVLSAEDGSFSARKLESIGHKVTALSQRNPGFNLKAEKPSETLKVEVKAHARKASSVFVTQREWEEHHKTLDVSEHAWELWNVENLVKSSDKTPTVQCIRHSPKSAMKESGHWIDSDQGPQEASRSMIPRLTN